MQLIQAWAGVGYFILYGGWLVVDQVELSLVTVPTIDTTLFIGSHLAVRQYYNYLAANWPLQHYLTLHCISQLNGTASATFSLRTWPRVVAKCTCGWHINHTYLSVHHVPCVVANYIPLSRARYRHLTRPSSSCEGRLRQTTGKWGWTKIMGVCSQYESPRK